jgi:hypothetical protein
MGSRWEDPITARPTVQTPLNFELSAKEKHCKI